MEENSNTGKMLRVYNWVFSISCILAGMVLMIQSTVTGMFYLLALLLMFIVTYTIPAILLYPGDSYILGAPLSINKKSKLLHRVSIGFNVAFLLVGVGITIFAFTKGAYPASFFGFIFFFLSFFNIKALSSNLKQID